MTGHSLYDPISVVIVSNSHWVPKRYSPNSVATGFKYNAVIPRYPLSIENDYDGDDINNACLTFKNNQ